MTDPKNAPEGSFVWNDLIRNALLRASRDAGDPVSVECIGQIVAEFLTCIRDWTDEGHIDLGDCWIETRNWGDLAADIEDIAERMQRGIP